MKNIPNRKVMHMGKLKIKKLPSTMKMFNLANDDEADQFYALLNYMDKKGIEIPVLAKGTQRVIDFGLRAVKKLDEELGVMLMPAM